MPKKQRQTKEQRRQIRLQKGKQWLLTYTGSPKHMNKHYRERFHVDSVTAAKDLQSLGVNYTQKQLDRLRSVEEYRIQQLHKKKKENNLQYTKKTGIYLGPTKTGKVRALKLAPQCVELIKEWKLEQMRMRLKQGSDWKETGMVFTKDNGEWLHPDSITRWLNNFSRDNGLPHIHPHAFRHTAASTMIANGVDLVTTANELGHANATTTAMIYAHQIAIAKARAADVRAGVFAGRDSKPKGSKLRSKFRGA